MEEGGQQPLDPPFDIDRGLRKARIAAIEGRNLRTRCLSGARERPRHPDLVCGRAGRWVTGYRLVPDRFAIDGFSRVLRVETVPFGVKVMVVEPSGFRTDWAGSSMTVHDIPEAYLPTVGAMNTASDRAPLAPPVTRPGRRRSWFRLLNGVTSLITFPSG